METLPVEILVRVAQQLDEQCDLAALVAASKLLYSLRDLFFRPVLKRDFRRTVYRGRLADTAEGEHALYCRLRGGAWRGLDDPIRDWDMADVLLSARRPISCGEEYRLDARRRASIFFHVMNSWSAMNAGTKELTVEDGMLLIELELAKDDVASLDIVATVNQRLDHMAQQLKMTGSESAAEALDRCMAFMFDELNCVAADSLSYYLPQSRYLHRACYGSGATGIPLILQVLLAALLRRAPGPWELELINSPRHLISRVRNTDVCCDAFARQVGPWARFRDAFGWSDRDLIVCTKRDIWTRALNNHLAAAGDHGARAPAILCSLFHMRTAPSDRRRLLEHIAMQCPMEELEREWLVKTVAEMRVRLPTPALETPRRRAQCGGGPRVHVGDVCVFGAARQRGIVVGWRLEGQAEGRFRICLLPEGHELREQWALLDMVDRVDTGGIPLRNRRVGKYFETFSVSDGYTPNKETRRLYPDDFKS